MNNIDWGFTFSVVLVGLVVMFAALVILIFLVWLMGKIFVAIGNKKKKDQQEKEQASRQQAQQAMEKQIQAEQAAPQVEEGIPPQVVAAISAAVAVVMEETAPGAAYTIQRVQRAGTGRSAWGNAGLAAQLSPFER